MMRPINLIATCLTLAACASAPTHYYTLIAHEHDDVTAPAAPFLIEVLPVGIPSQVDQPQLVVRHGEGGIVLLEGERWAAPLNDELRAALSTELTYRLGAQDIVGLAHPAGKPILRVKLEVRRFDSVLRQYALLDADWSLGIVGDPNSARLLCHSQLREPAGGDYASLVRAHQQAIAMLATQVSAAARSWVSSRHEACPVERL